MSNPTSGGYCVGVPPLPIPNREVKPDCADGTAQQCGRVGDRLFSYRGVHPIRQMNSFFFVDKIKITIPRLFHYTNGDIWQRFVPVFFSPARREPSCRLRPFLRKHLGVSQTLLTFAAMKQISNHHTTMNAVQKKVCFSASFNALYLHTPEKSVTHTHTHTHTHTFAPPVR